MKGRVLFTRFPVRGIKPDAHEDDDDEDAGTLLAYDFEQQRAATLARNVDEIRARRRRAHARSIVRTTRLRAIDAAGDLSDEEPEEKPATETGRNSGWLDLDRVSVEIEPRDEWAQMFREAWRLQREQFWVEDMSDVDWDRVLRPATRRCFRACARAPNSPT